MVSRFQADDLVWVRGSVRPGKIVLPNSMGMDILDPLQYVYFFGSHECEWWSESELTLHSEEMLESAENGPKCPMLQVTLEELKREITKSVEGEESCWPLEEPSCSKSNLRANTALKKVRKRRKKRNMSNLKRKRGKKNAQASTSNSSVSPEMVPQKNFCSPILSKDSSSNDSTSLVKSPIQLDNENGYKAVTDLASTSNSTLVSSEMVPQKNFCSPILSKDSSSNDSMSLVKSPIQLDNENGYKAVTDDTASTSFDNSNRYDSKEFDPATLLKKSQPSTSLLEVSKSADNGCIATSNIDQDRCEKSASLSLGISPDNDSNISVVENRAELSRDNISVLSSEDSGEPILIPLRECDIASLMKNCSKPIDDNMPATDKEIGFLGLGKMGSVIVQKLLRTGHLVTVWNRSPEKCQVFLDDGAKKAEFPSEVINRCDITFCCLSDENAVKDIFEGKKGVLEGFKECEDNKKGKGFVQLTALDSSISVNMSDSISEVGGKYLEAAMVSSTEDVQELSMIICAGDRGLILDCKTCFTSITNRVVFLCRNVGRAIKMKVLLSMINGSTSAFLQETMSLISRKNLPLGPFMDFLRKGPLSGPGIISKASALRENKTETPAEIESHLKTALLAGHSGNNMPIAAAVNQFYESAKHKADNSNECEQNHEDQTM